jgi:uncharacterized membrane protein
VLGGAVGAIGFEIGRGLRWLWNFMELPKSGSDWQRRMRLAGFGVAAAIASFCLYRAADWQNATRAVFGMEPVESSHVFTVGGIALAVFVLLWLVFRLFGILNRLVIRQLNRVLPPRVGMVIGFGLALWLFWALVDGVLVRQVFRIADASFEAADTFIPPDLTGRRLGRWGRSFVATAPTGTRSRPSCRKPAMDPVRVYVGRRAAETAEERAAIALAELIRQGGFERSTLVVVVPVGTGWMDPGGHDTLDFMLGGDVATVAVQYSYLTSVLSLFAHPEYGVGQSRALFDAVYDHWVTLPEAERPALYVHGLEPGRLQLADDPAAARHARRPDRRRDVGRIALLQPLLAVRAGEPPGRQPGLAAAFRQRLACRTLNQFGGLDGDFAPWGPVRLVFLNYGSDAIVVFNPASAWQPPDWMAASPRARRRAGAPLVPGGHHLPARPRHGGLARRAGLRPFLHRARLHRRLGRDGGPAGLEPGERAAELKAIFERRGLPR